jgi:hypothetical protein
MGVSCKRTRTEKLAHIKAAKKLTKATRVRGGNDRHSEKSAA